MKLSNYLAAILLAAPVVVFGSNNSNAHAHINDNSKNTATASANPVTNTHNHNSNRAYGGSARAYGGNASQGQNQGQGQLQGQMQGQQMRQGLNSTNQINDRSRSYAVGLSSVRAGLADLCWGAGGGLFSFCGKSLTSRQIVIFNLLNDIKFVRKGRRGPLQPANIVEFAKLQNLCKNKIMRGNKICEIVDEETRPLTRVAHTSAEDVYPGKERWTDH